MIWSCSEVVIHGEGSTTVGLQALRILSGPSDNMDFYPFSSWINSETSSTLQLRVLSSWTVDRELMNERRLLRAVNGNSNKWNGSIFQVSATVIFRRDSQPAHDRRRASWDSRCEVSETVPLEVTRHPEADGLCG